MYLLLVSKFLQFPPSLFAGFDDSGLEAAYKRPVGYGADWIGWIGGLL